MDYIEEELTGPYDTASTRIDLSTQITFGCVFFLVGGRGGVGGRSEVGRRLGRLRYTGTGRGCRY